MAFDGNGTFNRLYNWQSDAANGIPIQADRMDAEQDGIAGGLSICFLRDGQVPMEADLDVGNNKLLRVANPVADSDGVNKKWIEDNFLANTGDPLIVGTTPKLTFEETDQISDLNKWRLQVSSTDFIITPLKTDSSLAVGYLRLLRDSNGLTDAELLGGTGFSNSAPNGNSLINRNRGDARYPTLASGGTISGQINLDSGTYNQHLRILRTGGGASAWNVTQLVGGDLEFNGPSTFLLDNAGGAVSDNSILKRSAADARYLRQSGGTLTGNLTVNNASININTGNITQSGSGIGPQFTRSSYGSAYFNQADIGIQYIGDGVTTLFRLRTSGDLNAMEMDSTGKTTFRNELLVNYATPQLRINNPDANSASRMWALTVSAGTSALLFQNRNSGGSFNGQAGLDSDFGLGTSSSIGVRAAMDSRYSLASSSRRFKENIQRASHVDGFDLLEVKEWTWGGVLDKDDPKRGNRGRGLIAEEVEPIYPEAVIYDRNGQISGLDALTLCGILFDELQETKIELREVREHLAM